jgi:hypothetical protein
VRVGEPAGGGALRGEVALHLKARVPAHYSTL